MTVKSDFSDEKAPVLNFDFKSAGQAELSEGSDGGKGFIFFNILNAGNLET